MRVLLLSYTKSDNRKQTEILKKLEQTAVSCGHQVDVKSGEKDIEDIHLIIYDYIAVIVPASPLFGAKVPSKLPEVLSQCGNVSGKKGAALVIKSGFSSAKMCNVVMKAMEKEGMFVDYFEVVESVDHATAVGRKIG
ncbi:MAG: hypothetical protein KBT02_05625 [Treponema sp.]|nr:hypothetical protein [Candidatus Treponema caballi]